MSLFKKFGQRATQQPVAPEAKTTFADLFDDVRENLVLKGYNIGGFIDPVHPDQAMLYVYYSQTAKREAYKIQCDRDFRLGTDLDGSLKIKIHPEGTWALLNGTSVTVSSAGNEKDVYDGDSLQKAVEQFTAYIDRDIEAVKKGADTVYISHP